MQKGIRPSEAELREMGRRIDKALETIPAMTYAQMGRLVNSYTRRIHSLSRTLYFERGGSWEIREVDSKHRESNYYDVTRLAVKKYVVRRDPEDGHLLIGRKTDVFHVIAVQDIQVAMMRDRMDERGWTMIYSGKSNQMGKHVRMRYMDEYEIGMYLVPFRLMSEKAYRHVHGYLHRMQRLHGDDAIRVVLLIKKSGYASAVKSMKDWLSRNSDVSHSLYALPYEDVVQNPEYYLRSIFDHGAWSYETLERMVGVKSGGEFYQKYSEGKDWMIGGGTIVAKVNETWSVLAAWNGNIASLIQWGHLGDEAFASVSVKGERVSAYLWLTAPNALMGEVMHKLAHSKGVKRLTDMPSLQEVEVKECFYDPDQEDEGETVERGWDEVELTNEQEAAVMHGTGPALVVAAAGSGKTRVLIARIKRLIEAGVHPRSILACTFTKKAAQEMKARLVHEVGERAKQVRMETMHAVAFRLLREMNPQVEVLVDSTHVVEWALEKESGNLREQVDANEWMMRIMRQKSEGIMPEQVEDPDLQRMYATYERLKTNSKRVDFEDLIVMTLQALRKKDRVALTWREGIEYVLVDEFQDTNRAQWEWLKEVAAPRRNLFCVGDDWQSIYGFRGSRPELMQEMKETYAGTKMYYLTRNYRSFFVIVGLSNDLINHFNQGFHIDKVVKPGVGRDDEYSGYAPFEVDDEQAEANMVARVILNRHFPFRGYAVLYRTNAQSQIYAEALSEQGIPYEVVGDTPFFASKRVKAALDYLRTSIDTENADHWRGIINQPNRRIGLTEIEELVELGWRGVEEHRNLWDLTSAIEELQRRESPADGLRWLLTSGMKELAYAKDDEPVKWVDVVLSQYGGHTEQRISKQSDGLHLGFSLPFCSLF